MVARFSAPVQTGPGANTASCTIGTVSFLGGKELPGRDADPSPLLVTWSRKSRAIPLLPLGAVRRVQGLSACTRVQFIIIIISSSSSSSGSSIAVYSSPKYWPCLLDIAVIRVFPRNFLNSSLFTATCKIFSVWSTCFCL